MREAGITELRGSEEWPVPARVSHRVRWSRARAVAPFRPLSNRSPNGSAGWIRAVPDLSPLMPLRRASPMPRWAVISNDLICSAETGVDTCMGRSWAWAVQRQLLPVPPHPPCATNREWQPYRSRTCPGDTEQEYFTATAWSRRSSSRFPHPLAVRHGTYNGTYKGQAVDVKQVE